MQSAKLYILLTLLSLFLFLPGLTSLPIIDRDEAHFAQATRQMLQTGNYFQIRFQEVTRFQKPPGINWLQAASVAALSHADAPLIWPYRIPSVVGGLLSVLFTFFFARRFIADKVAWLGAAFLAASLLLVVEAHMAVIDAALLLTVVLMQGSLWIIYHAGLQGRRTSTKWACLFWFAMALGFVLKGVTPLVGLLTIIALCGIEKRIDWLRCLYPVRGSLFFVGVGLFWLALVNHAEQSNYLWQMLHRDLLPKLKGGHESHGQPPFFHAAILLITFWPASLFLLPAAVFAFKKRKEETVRFLLAWILPVWIFFELMPTKLPQYVLPTFPAIALLCSLSIFNMHQSVTSKKALTVWQMIWGIAFVVLFLTVAAIPFLVEGQLTVASGVLVGIAVCMSTLCIYSFRKRNFQIMSLSILLSALLIYPIVFNGIFSPLTRIWVSRTIAQSIPPQRISADNPLLAVGFSEPSLVFYLNTQRVRYSEREQALALSKQHPQQLLLFNQEEWEKLSAQKREFTLLTQGRGYNYSKGRWINWFLVERRKNDTF